MKPVFAMVSLALLLGLPQMTFAVDTDGDGVPDELDNCVLVYNPPPFDCDTDQDGYGNLCDPDFDQNFVVNALDYTRRFLPDFLNPPPASNCGGFDCVTSGGTNHALDGTNMDCSADGPNGSSDGSVNAADAVNFSHYFQGPSQPRPGPSGLACAGVPGCS